MKGQVLIFTGEGKGKTSSALGTVIRALGNGWRVGWLAFYKEESWKLSEVEFFKKLPVEIQQNLTIHLGGKGFYIPNPTNKSISGNKIASVNNQVVIDDDQPEDHQRSAHQVLDKATQMVESGKYEVIVLDEVCNALKDQLISLQEVLSFIKKRGSIHVILTGRYCPPELIKVADMVTEMKKVKHPFDAGQNAIKGLDF